MSRRLNALAVLVLSCCFGVPRPAAAGPVTTFTDLDAFLAAAGDVREIDFETLPDGSPSIAFTPITPDFNYTEQGVTFSSPFPVLEIRGDPGFFGLVAQNRDTGARNWITGELQPNAFAVGVTFVFPILTTLRAYDENIDLIAEVTDRGQFLGVVTDIPIVWITQDNGQSSGQDMDSFLFTPVPEPGSLFLLAAGTGFLIARRGSRNRRSGHLPQKRGKAEATSTRSSNALVIILCLGVIAQATRAQTRTYSTVADFDNAFVINSTGSADASDGSTRRPVRFSASI